MAGICADQTQAYSNVATHLETDLLAAAPVRQMVQLAAQGPAHSLHIDVFNQQCCPGILTACMWCLIAVSSGGIKRCLGPRYAPLWHKSSLAGLEWAAHSMVHWRLDRVCWRAGHQRRCLDRSECDPLAGGPDLQPHQAINSVTELHKRQQNHEQVAWTLSRVLPQGIACAARVRACAAMRYDTSSSCCWLKVSGQPPGMLQGRQPHP